MEGVTQWQQALDTLIVTIDQAWITRYSVNLKEQDNKNLKKKLKKWQIEADDSQEKALEKVGKLIEELCKQFELAGKQEGKVRIYKEQVDASESQRDKIAKQKGMFDNLFAGFRKKYDEEINKAQQVEKEEEVKRKTTIEELQERIKVIQARYEEAGKAKIEKYKENQTLKHQLSKYQPHLIASQSLADAQLKKKAIEIEIQMTTLKQKIDMMDNFKNMRVETEQKLIKSKQVSEKITPRLEKLEKKEQQHKIRLAKAHLVFEDYKKAFNVLKDTLPKKERQAFTFKEKVKKSASTLQEIKKKIADLEKEQEKENNSLNVLLALEGNLQKQL